jgi:hypothetical protein
MSQPLIPAGVVFVADVAGVDHMLLPQHLCQQLVILFLAEDALFVVIHHILQMSAQIVVLDAFNGVLFTYMCACFDNAACSNVDKRIGFLWFN